MAESLRKLVQGKTWNARPIVKDGLPATEFHGKWLHYLDADDAWQDIDCLIKETAEDFRVVEAPFNFIASKFADEAVLFESDNRFDVFNKTKITAAPFGVRMRAIQASHVAGQLFDINGDGRLDAVIYPQAFPQWNADLIYYVKHGRAPRLEKLVRFNSEPAADLDIEFELVYSDVPEITPTKIGVVARNDLRVINRELLKVGGKISHDKGFYIRKWDEPQKRGIGMKAVRIWDSGQTR